VRSKTKFKVGDRVLVLLEDDRFEDLDDFSGDVYAGTVWSVSQHGRGQKYSVQVDAIHSGPDATLGAFSCVDESNIERIEP